MRRFAFVFFGLNWLLGASLLAKEDQEFRLMGPDGHLYVSPVPGELGGNRKLKIVGRLDCRSALAWLRRGKYKDNRVFFASARVAALAGYRPCGVCMPKAYEIWKAGGDWLRFVERNGFQ